LVIGDRVLAGDVGDQVRHRADAADRRRVDDRARALGLEVRQRVLHPVQHALEVDSEHLVEHLGAVRLDRVLLALDTGVVV